MRNRIEYDIRAKDSFSKPMKDFKSKLTQITRTTKPANAGMARVQTQLRKTGNSFKNITLDANRANTSFKQLNGVLIGLRGAIGTIGMYRLARGLGGAIQSAMSMVEAQNLFHVAMGESAGSAGEFLSKISTITGLDYTGLQRATGTFALLSRSMGISTANAETLSLNMTKLSLDLASLHEIPIAQVMQDLRSGLVGQTETIYKYGVDITEASLKQEAMNQGITKSVRNMSQGEKMALRYSLTIKKAALAHGDFAKTIESPANQAKILTDRMTTLARSIGTIFLPSITVILPYLNAVVQLLTKWANAIASIVGYKAEKPSDSIGEIGDNASDATGEVEGLGKALDKLSGGFDELNVLAEPSGSGGSGVSVGGTGDFEFPNYDSKLEDIRQKSDEIMEDMSDKMDVIFGWLDKVTEPIQLALPELGEGIMQTWEWLYNDVLKPIGEWTVSEGIPTFFEAVASAISTMGTALKASQPALESFNDNFLSPIGSFAGETFINFLEDFIDLMEDLQDIMEGDMDFSELGFGQKVAVGTGAILLFSKIAGLFTPLGATAMAKGALPATVAGMTALSKISIPKAMLSAMAFMGGFELGDYLFNDNKETGKEAPFGGTGDFIFDTFMKPWAQLAVDESFRGQLGSEMDKVGTVMGDVWANTGLKSFAESLEGVFSDYASDGVDHYISAFKLALANHEVSIEELEIVIDELDVSESSKEKIKKALGMIKPDPIAFFNTIEGFDELLLKEGEKQRKAMVGPWETALGEMGLTLETFKTDAELAYELLYGNMETTGDDNAPTIKSTWGDIWNTMRTKLTTATGEMDEDHDAFLKKIAKDASDAKGPAEKEYSALFTGMQSVVTTVIDAMGSKLSGFLSALGVFKTEVERANRMEINPPTLPAVNPVNGPNFVPAARGGMIERGMLFQAGEAGAELLGSYGGKQTVMPLENSGFVESMYQAVYNAVSSAQGQGGSVIENVVELDGEVIYRNQQKVERNRGKNFNMGAFAR